MRFYFEGLGNAVAIQVRCISLLLFPMYCGKPGRGVLKAVVLTYVVAGKNDVYLPSFRTTCVNQETL